MDTEHTLRCACISNVGVDLMFGFDNADYDDKGENHCVVIYADVIISRVYWDTQTKTLHHNDSLESHDSLSPYDADYHLTLIRGQIAQLNKWHA